MSEALEQSDIREGYKEVQFGPKTLVVPSDWSTERFGDVFHRRRESIDDIEDETVKYVGLKHLDSGQLTINGYDEDGRERSSSRVFHKGDVLFGKLRPNLNKAAVAPFSGVCSSDILPIYAEEDARQQYLPYLMHSKLVRDRVVSTMEGTNLPRTSWDDLEKTLIPLPPLPEQRRIADILSTVDEQIQQTDEIIEGTKALRRGLINEFLYTHEDRETSTERFGPLELVIPKGWGIKTIKSICNYRQLGTGDRSDPDDDSVSLIKMGNLTIGSWDFSEIEKMNRDEELIEKYRLEDGDLLFNTRNSPELVGKTAVWNADFPAVFDNNLMRLRFTEEVYSSEFVNLVLSSGFGRRYLRSFVHGTTSVAAIYWKDLATLRMPLPPVKKQKEIVEIASAIDEKIKKERETKQHLQELKRGLMQDLLTGKVRVNTD